MEQIAMRVAERIHWECSRGDGQSVAFALLFALALLLLPASAFAASATRTSSWQYDAASGLPSQEVIEPDNQSLRLVTDFTLDAFGNRIAAAVSGGTGISAIAPRTTATAYDAQGRFAVSVTSPPNQNGNSLTEAFQYDPASTGPAHGEPTSHDDVNGLTTSWDYDSFGRKTRETRPDGTHTDFTYSYCSDAGANCPAIPNDGATGGAVAPAYFVQATPFPASGSAPSGPAVTTYCDALGRVIATDTQGFDGAAIRQATQYDAAGRAAKVSRPYFVSGGSPQWTTNVYDDLGRVTAIVQPNTAETDIAYGALTVTVTNALGQTTTSLKNARGETVRVTDAKGYVTQYGYGPFGNLIWVSDQDGNLTTNQFDGRGRKTTSNDPDMGSWSYAFDVLSEVTTQTNANGNVTSFQYDALGRVIHRDETDVTADWSYDCYDAGHRGRGKLCQESTSAGYQKALAYDALGRATQTSITLDGATDSFTTAYDPDKGWISAATYPSGFSITYAYTALGYLQGLTDTATGAPLWTASAANAELQITQEASGNGLAATYAFDPKTGLIQSVKAGAGDAAASFSYAFDYLGNLTNRTDANQSLAETFFYDDLNRLVQYAVGAAPAKTVAYDATGSILAKSDTGLYAYPGAGTVRPHAVQSIAGALNAAYSYDANGNLTGDSVAGRTVLWTPANMVASIAQGTIQVGFVYDAEHQRAKSVTAINGDATATYYLADAASGLSAEKAVGASSSVKWTSYISAGGRRLGMRVTTASGSYTRYFIGDHLASVSVLTDESGAVAERLSYDAWGKRRLANGQDGTPPPSQTTRGYTDHEMIDALSLINMNGRIQDPTIGKFLSADPIIQGLTDGDEFNTVIRVDDLAVDYATAELGNLHDISTGVSGGTLHASPAYGAGVNGGPGPGTSSTPYFKDGRTSNGLVVFDTLTYWGGVEDLSLGRQFLNRYSYVSNNPLNTTDPSGKCPWCVTAAVGALENTAVEGGIILAEGLGGQQHSTLEVLGRLGSAAIVGGGAGATGYGIVALGVRAEKAIVALEAVTSASKTARVVYRASVAATAGAAANAEVSVGRQLTDKGEVDLKEVAHDAKTGAIVGGGSGAALETTALALRKMGMKTASAQLHNEKSTLGRTALGAQTAVGGFTDARNAAGSAPHGAACAEYERGDHC